MATATDWPDAKHPRDEFWNAASMVPGVLLGGFEVRAMAVAHPDSTCVLVPLAYILSSLASLAFHAHVHVNRGRIANFAYLRADLSAQLLTSALTVVHTPFGTRGLAFVIACGAASWSLDLRRDATIVYAIHGACFFVAAGAVPNVVYAMGGVAVAIFIVNGMRPNAWFHAGFHLAVDVTLHEVWRHMRCPASGLKNWMPR